MRRGMGRTLIVGVLNLAGAALFSAGCKEDPTAVTPPCSTPVCWVPYGQALPAAEQENKPVMVFFYTTWCGWSRRMDRDVLADSSVAAFLGQHFVSTRIDAESKEPIPLGGNTTDGIRLAAEYGVHSFPTCWFLSPKRERLERVSGYVPADSFLATLARIHDHPRP